MDKWEDKFMSKLIFSLPKQLVARMKVTIPTEERSEVVANFLQKEIEAREKDLYIRASSLENHKSLQKEMVEWNKEFENEELENA